MPKTQHADPLLETLTQLALGEISLEQAAAVLDTSTGDLVELIEASPQLVAEADARALTKRMDPQRVIERSHAGLSAAVDALAERIQRDAGDMATSELLQSAKTLESLVAFSKAREAELKGDRGQDEPVYPLLIQDCRVDGQLRLFLIPPSDPRWIDTRKEEFQTPNFDWLETFAPITGDGHLIDMQRLLEGHIRVMTAKGLVTGGAS